MQDAFVKQAQNSNQHGRNMIRLALSCLKLIAWVAFRFMFRIKTLFLLWVHSRLDYCNSVLVRLSWSLVQQLQSVLNSAARLIFGLKRFDRITPALMDLHWLPYPQRITYKLCMIMFKCLRGSASAYLLTIVLVLLWCLVDRLWDLLLMVTLLFIVSGQTGV